MNFQLLLQKLPEIQAWIAATLREHHAQARPVSAYGLPGLPRFYPPELLGFAQVVEVPRVPVPPLSAMGFPELGDFERRAHRGITYLGTYFIQADSAGDEALHFHELVHIVQWRHLGPERFLTGYALGHLLSGGYRANPFEAMAYELQDRFEYGCVPFPVEPEVCQRLGQLVPAIMAQAGA